MLNPYYSAPSKLKPYPLGRPESGIRYRRGNEQFMAKTRKKQSGADTRKSRVPRKARGRLRTQYAALPVRHVDGRPEVMLITSRDTGRWIVPKGWPEKGMPPFEVARMEAFEEAGIKGSVAEAPVTRYRYRKTLSNDRSVTVEVDVFLLAVERELDRWPEMAERRRAWYPAAQAAMMISDSGMKSVLLSLGAGALPEEPAGVPELASAET